MDDFGGRPVAVRLAYRYPNGSMISYSARALAREEQSLRVMVKERFEAGIALSVWAPFQDGLTMYRVLRVLKSKKQPGYFEILLRHADADPSDSQAKAKSQEAAAIPPALVIDSVAGAAERLGDILAQAPARRFSEALGKIPTESRPLALMAAAAAVLTQLEERGLVHTRSLFVRTKELMHA